LASQSHGGLQPLLTAARAARPERRAPEHSARRGATNRPMTRPQALRPEPANLPLLGIAATSRRRWRIRSGHLAGARPLSSTVPCAAPRADRDASAVRISRNHDFVSYVAYTHRRARKLHRAFGGGRRTGTSR